MTIALKKAIVFLLWLKYAHHRFFFNYLWTFAQNKIFIRWTENSKGWLRLSKQFCSSLFPLFYLQKVTTVFLFFPTDLFSSDNYFTMISSHVNNIFYFSVIRIRFFWIMWESGILSQSQTAQLCVCLGHGSDYSTGK